MKYTHLSLEERERLYALVEQGKSFREMTIRESTIDVIAQRDPSEVLRSINGYLIKTLQDAQDVIPFIVNDDIRFVDAYYEYDECLNGGEQHRRTAIIRPVFDGTSIVGMHIYRLKKDVGGTSALIALEAGANYRELTNGTVQYMVQDGGIAEHFDDDAGLAATAIFQLKQINDGLVDDIEKVHLALDKSEDKVMDVLTHHGEKGVRRVYE